MFVNLKRAIFFDLFSEIDKRLFLKTSNGCKLSAIDI